MLFDYFEDQNLPQTPILSVWLLTFNHRNFFENSIQSILAQKTNFDYEIVIGDDCSIDGTRELVLKYYKSNSSKVRLILSKKNYWKQLGPALSLELYKSCRGTYIATCEGDDYWTDPYKLQKQVDYLEANPHVSCCATDFDQINKVGVFEKNPEPYPSIVKLNSEDVMRSRWSPTQTCTVVFKRGLLNPTPEFFYDKLIYCGDWALVCLFSTKGEVHILPDTTATKRMDADGIWSSKSNLLNAYRLICFSSRMPRYLPTKYKLHFYQNLVREIPSFLEQLIYLKSFTESAYFIFSLLKIPIQISFIPSIVKTFFIILLNTFRMRSITFQ